MKIVACRETWRKLFEVKCISNKIYSLVISLPENMDV